MNTENLSRTLVKGAVLFDQDPFTDKEDMFSHMADKFLESGIITDKEAYIDALHYRESLGSTYMGNLIGLPHGKCKEVTKPGIGFCRCAEPFAYESNGEKGDVKYVFMLAISQNQTADDYMRTLADLAGLLVHEDFISQLDLCRDYDQLLETIRNY